MPNKDISVNSSFETSYQEFVFYRTYSRWNHKKGRRETWEETVERYFDFMIQKVPEQQHRTIQHCKKFVLERKVIPSMRAMWSAGKALERDNVAAYNCSYVTIDRLRVFAEMMYILSCGCGVGYSVESRYTSKLPPVPEEIKDVDKTIKFRDSKIGWSEGFLKYLEELYRGERYKYDLSSIRKEGELLKTFGGRASGPKPLKELLDFSYDLIFSARGRKLHPIECHDLCCYIANCIVSGGVRRSACISLSDLNDNGLKSAKKGAFWHDFPYRALSNNSVAYEERPDMRTFMEEWFSLVESKTGERGFFNRRGGQTHIEKIGRRDPRHEFGVNPCGEILLRPQSFCNLTEVVIRSNDTLSTLQEKVKIAAILGILQSTLTNFRFLGKKWKDNCEEERLLGVSLTGIADHKVLSGMENKSRITDWLNTMRETGLKSAKKWSKIMGINMPAAITTIKPSGTASQLLNTSSGIHPRYSPYYIRRVRVSRTDPLCQFLIDKGVPYNPEVGTTIENCSSVVFDFPVKAPPKSVLRDQRSAIEQLEFWKVYKQNWSEHQPSITIYVKDEEWLEVGSWVYKHWDDIGGVSFLPFDAGVYQLPPYEEIDKETYETLYKAMPKLDFSELVDYEKDDYTTGSKELACTGGACELP